MGGSIKPLLEKETEVQKDDMSFTRSPGGIIIRRHVKYLCEAGTLRC